MKKILLTIISSITLFCTPLFAFEWGGVVKSFTDYSTTDFSTHDFKQKEEIYLWGKLPFGKQSPFSLIGEGVYKGTFNVTENPMTMENILDIDILKVSGTLEFGKSSSVYLACGRINAFDNSRKLFSQLIDGAQSNFIFEWGGISLFGGYTGFVNSHSTSMMEKDGTVFVPTTMFYSFAIPYLVADAKLEMPFIGGSSIYLEGIGFFDTRDFNDSRYFGELGMSGPFMGSVFYKFNTVVGTNNAFEISNYTTLDYYWYPLEFFMINFGIEYASGSIGFLKPFSPVTSQIACESTETPSLAGAIIPNISISISNGGFYSSLTGKYVMFLPETELFQYGAEADWFTQVNIFSDLKVTLDVKAFIDVTNSNLSKYSGSLGLAVSF